MVLGDPKWLKDGPEGALERARARAELDRIEGEDLGFHQRVREGFLEEARLEPQRFLVVAADRPAAQVHEDVIEALGMTP